jgi:hypothetical protein
MTDSSRVPRPPAMLIRSIDTQGAPMSDQTPVIDFALTVVAEMSGPQTALAIQLQIEYAPAPPFDSGLPGKARSSLYSPPPRGRGARCERRSVGPWVPACAGMTLKRWRISPIG